MRQVALALVLAVGLAAAWAPTASAEVVVHEKAGIQLWIPDGWDAESDDDGLTIYGPNEEDAEVVVTFHIMKVKKIAEALDAIDDELDEVCDDLKVTSEAEHLTINGLDAIAVEADAVIDGEAVEMALMIVDTPHHNRVLLAFGVGSSDHIRKHKANLAKVLRSIKETE